MSAWPGGKCPSCELDVPANVIRCPECRVLLNDSLEMDSVEMPAFVPLQEISTMYESEPRGHFCECPACHKELRINRKYAGAQVQCKFCQAPFVFATTDPNLNVKAHYVECPHCHEELRAASKYLGTAVACKFCKGHIQLVERVAQS